MRFLKGGKMIRKLTSSILIVVFVVSLSGCARGFIKQGCTLQDFYRDLYNCETQNTPRRSFCIGPSCDVQASNINRRIDLCMFALGWESSKTKGAFRK